MKYFESKIPTVTEADVNASVDSLIQNIATEEDIEKLRVLIKDLKKQIKVLETPLPLFKENSIVMLKENKLLVKITKVLIPKNIKKAEIQYSVCYNHFYPDNVYASDFVVKESELEEKPKDYDKVIFNAYLEKLVELQKLKELLKR